MATVHKDICIRFTIDGRNFQAVGFLGEDEAWVYGDTMLQRVPDAIGEEDWTFLSERTNQFPEKLRRYYLVTNQRRSNGPRDISYFDWDDDGWDRGWVGFGFRFDDFNLVLRRCP